MQVWCDCFLVNMISKHEKDESIDQNNFQSINLFAFDNVYYQGNQADYNNK
jgi:hypothetical protein